MRKVKEKGGGKVTRKPRGLQAESNLFHIRKGVPDGKCRNVIVGGRGQGGSGWVEEVRGSQDNYVKGKEGCTRASHQCRLN